MLETAVRQPGLLLKAYTAFHDYSLGNQVAAMVQCTTRGIEPGPINTYRGWQDLGRQVKRGEKALWLCMPLASKRKNDSGEDEHFIKAFVWKPRWFTLSQTEGEPVPMPEIPEWNKDRALETLAVTQVEFSEINGNVQGYAVKHNIAISPLAAMPWKTLFHELAHVTLGHTEEADFHDSERTPRSLREVEAEAVALLLCESLELPGADFCRGYIQNWLESDVIPEKSAQKIFGVADRILRAGRINNI
jgi:hypothetical protein